MTNPEPFMQLDDDLVQHMANMLATYNYPSDTMHWNTLTAPQSSCVPSQEVKVYKLRENVKASEKQRLQSRNYYRLHREEILIKRRLHRDRLIKEGRLINYTKKKKIVRS